MLNVNIWKCTFEYYPPIIHFLCTDFPNLIVFNNMTISFWGKNELS